jgi:hypothetical protein
VAGLDAQAVLLLVVEHGVVGLGKDGARDGRDLRGDVTGAGRVLAALDARAELTAGHEQVGVVAAAGELHLALRGHE